MTAHVLAFDIGRSTLTAGLVAADGRVFQPHSAPTPTVEGAAAILTACEALGRQILGSAQAAGLTAVAVGAGVAGLLDREGEAPTPQTLTGWEGTPIANALQAAFQLPVAVDKAVNVLALGEQHFGAGRGYSHVLYVTIDAGLSAAIVKDGVLWRGASFSAGEIAHLLVDLDGRRRCRCGGRGHLEAYVSGPALAAQYREFSGRDEVQDLGQVAERARAGDTLAQQVIASGGRLLGHALAGLVGLLDPQAVVIAGELAELDEEWWEPLTAALRAAPRPAPAAVTIRRAELGGQARLVGAAWLASNR